jgi:uncharacterized protein YndB with AHSA1/START domain
MSDLHDIRHPGLTEHVRIGDQSILHRRRFAASADRVQRAHTDADLFEQWMGPRGTTLQIDRLDAVTGGAFRYIVRSTSGGSWAFRGSYHEVAPGRIVHTWEYEAEPSPTLEILRFVDMDDGGSILEVTSTYTSKAACDAMLESGMDAGMDEDFERLDAVLASDN